MGVGVNRPSWRKGDGGDGSRRGRGVGSRRVGSVGGNGQELKRVDIT